MIFVENFLYNFFSIFIDLYKINFGFLYNLNTFNKESIDYIDLGFFMEIQIYLYKFFELFKQKYINKYLYKYKIIKNNYKIYNIFLGKIIKYKYLINK